MARSRSFLVGLSAVALLAVGAGGAPTSVAAPAVESAHRVDVTQAPYNAVGDGDTNDRPAIQAAIDDVADRGGGTVVLPADRSFLSGSLILRSRVTLRVDGTLLQSQRDTDYDVDPIRGHSASSMLWDVAWLHNTPFIHAAHARDVHVEGAGDVQLTRAASEQETIHLSAVGFYDVQDYSVRDIGMLGASGYTMSLFRTTDGLVQNTRILPLQHTNTDGISLQNSQRVRISGNTLRTNDDGIYVWSSYNDPRAYAPTWWSSSEPQASRDIEVDHNDLDNWIGKAFAIIAWGSAAPDQRQVEISDVYVHDNKLRVQRGEAVGCWCDDPYDDLATQAPVKRIRIENNSYEGHLMFGAEFVDFVNDFGAIGARSLHNGDFDHTGDAWWTSHGRAGATRADEPAIDNRHAQRLMAETSDWLGYLDARPHRPATLSQDLSLRSAEDFPFDLGGRGIEYRLTARLAGGGSPVTISVRDLCRGQTLAEQEVDSRHWTSVSLDFALVHQCGKLQIAVEMSDDHPGWALVDDLALETTWAPQVIDDKDPRAVFTGPWNQWDSSADIGGTHHLGVAAGARVVIPFTGTRAILIGTTRGNRGLADIYVDGVKHGVADFYADGRFDQQVIYDTGTLPAGDHTFELVTTWTRNPASSNNFTYVDALMVAP